MKNYIFYIILYIIINSLSGCVVTKEAAPIEYHHRHADSGLKQTSERTMQTIYDNDETITSSSVHDQDTNESEIIRPSDDKENNIMPAPIAKEELKKQPSKKEIAEENYKIINHTVKEDETIEDIASYYGQKTEAIAELNDLSPPFELNEFQILKIKVPKDAQVKTKLATKIETQGIKEVKLPVGAKYIKPTDGNVITKFGQKTEHGVSKGINIVAPEGTKVVSSSSGKVIYADYDATFGNLVIVKIDDTNTVLSYAHLTDLEVKKGAILRQGDLIGHVGKTGKVKQPQLHFAVREGKVAVDPLKFVSYNVSD